MQALCYLIVADARRNGRKGVFRKPRAQQCMEYLYGMMAVRLKELKLA